MNYTEPERKAILRMASVRPADQSIRNEAIQAHRSMMARNRVAKAKIPYGDPYFEFMREIDSPCPDYGLRAHYRQKIIASATDQT